MSAPQSKRSSRPGDWPRFSPSGSRSISVRSRRRARDPHAELKTKIHQTCIARLGTAFLSLEGTTSLRRVRRIVVEELNAEESPLSPSERSRLEQQIADDILGYGPLEPFLRDDVRHGDHGQRRRPTSTSSAPARSSETDAASPTTRISCGSSTGSCRRSAGASTSRRRWSMPGCPTAAASTRSSRRSLCAARPDDPEVRARSRSRSPIYRGSAR